MPRLRDLFRVTPRMLSVVLPVYQVEDYLAECLESILGQRLPRGVTLEVVCVDDGSTDSSPELLDRFAARDDRVVVVRQQNAGLGAARNAGVARARGDLLTFCDSDDVVPDGAYDALLRAQGDSGSDIVIGALERFGDATGDRGMGPLMRRNHRDARSGVTLVEQPLLLADVFAVNKVYRREFWDRAGLAFPVDTRYEDQPTLTRALVAAASIDVLTEVVYDWRIRADGSSITQGRARLEDLVDRVATKRDSTAVVESLGDAEVSRTWFEEVLPIDLWEYFRASLVAGDEYWERLVAAMQEFWPAESRGFERSALPVQQRLMGALVTRGRRTDLAAVIEAIDAHGVHPRDGSDVVDLPCAGDPTLPSAAWTYAEGERRG